VSEFEMFKVYKMNLNSPGKERSMSMKLILEDSDQKVPEDSY